MKWTWFRKDAWGFTLGIVSILVGIYAIVEYVNVAVGQRGAEILVFTGSILIFGGGVVHNVYITICWLRKKIGRHTDTRDLRLIRKVAFGFTWGILAVLLGIVIAYLGYTNYSPFHVVVGSAWILLGVVGVMYAILFLRNYLSEVKT